MIPSRDTWDGELVRVRVVLAGMLVAFVLLGFALWQIQVARAHVYRSDLRKQSVRRILLPGVRGKIYDRHGACLADNGPNHCLAIYMEELRQPGGTTRTLDKAEEVIGDLSGILGLEPQVSREQIRIHMRKRLPLPLFAWRGLDEKALARWAEGASHLPGVGIYTEAVRVYPQGQSACHLLGYVGKAEPVQKEEEPFDYYMPGMIGRSGVEKQFDQLLQGEAGGRLVRVDVVGFLHDEIRLREPKAGQDVLLAIDLRIQKAAEEALGDEPGAAVVLDPRNGDVLAMASTPGFDPNVFIPSISQSDWDALNLNPDKPLLNRAAAGAYTPGSTFKPVVAIAALEGRKCTPNTEYNCPGHFEIGNRTSYCWYKPGHGSLNMRQALRDSCNVYFWKLALDCGYDHIYHMALALGLGRKTGIGLDYERAGLLPNDGWKRRVEGDGWRDGDTVNLAIGQGALTTTPLQMALVTSAIANGGFVYRPRLVLGTRQYGAEVFRPVPVELVNNMHWSPETVRVVQGGMRDVVMAPRGTGKAAQVEGLTMAGKTGTAEYGKKGAGLRYGWMIAYAPFEDPRYAVAVVVDKAVSGPLTAAPRVRKLLEEIFLGEERARGAG